ncbi:MAG: 50S ribosomal protein L11 methyltransferase [Bacteroidetes bacterium]|nr:50S ribosomal protein L11 methyltransferase [Bacteroidota bacterium]
MYYTRLKVECASEFSEILIAELGECGFDTFMENESGFEAYAEQEQYDSSALIWLKEKYTGTIEFTYSVSRVEKENWNEQWENSFEPVVVEEACVVRAEFHHLPRTYPYEIVITPKMSFGTGHHATTWLMLKIQLHLDQFGKKVMDAGCGTTVLSIMAEKRGAELVDAFDIDEWSVENGNENIANNGCKKIRLRQGTVRSLSFDQKFDIVLANINKNILLDEMDAYAAALSTSGHLVLSGFFETDAADLIAKAKPFGFQELSRELKEGWCALLLKKN